MRGFITEQHFDEAEREFPGIVALYSRLDTKPRTFLDLVQVYLAQPDHAASSEHADVSGATSL